MPKISKKRKKKKSFYFRKTFNYFSLFWYLTQITPFSNTLLLSASYNGKQKHSFPKGHPVVWQSLGNELWHSSANHNFYCLSHFHAVDVESLDSFQQIPPNQNLVITKVNSKLKIRLEDFSKSTPPAPHHPGEPLNLSSQSSILRQRLEVESNKPEPSSSSNPDSGSRLGTILKQNLNQKLIMHSTYQLMFWKFNADSALSTAVRFSRN